MGLLSASAMLTVSYARDLVLREEKMLTISAGFDTLIANYGTDVPNLTGDHTSYLYGPGTILVAHGDDEAIKVGDLEEAVEGYKKLIKHALKV